MRGSWEMQLEQKKLKVDENRMANHVKVYQARTAWRRNWKSEELRGWVLPCASGPVSERKNYDCLTLPRWLCQVLLRPRRGQATCLVICAITRRIIPIKREELAHIQKAHLAIDPAAVSGGGNIIHHNPTKLLTHLTHIPRISKVSSIVEEIFSETWRTKLSLFQNLMES